MFTKDSAVGIVKEGLQPGSLALSAPKPDNITVFKERESVRFKEEKKRLKKKPRETVKKIEVVGHFGTDRVDVVRPCESLMVTSRNVKE